MNSQRGAALLIVLLILIVGGLLMIAPRLFRITPALSQQGQVDLTLLAAREALIGFSTGTVAGGIRPGDMLFPDALNKTESPRNYDGKWDSGCYDRSKTDGTLISSGGNMRCLGRLPWRDLNLQLADSSENDPSGVMPWYAVSANLVDPCLKAINPGILALTYPGSYPASCPGAPTDTQLPHPWLTVRDAQGNVLSDRVAFVVILPGPPVGPQNRPTSPNLAGAGGYLDSYAVRINSTGCPNGLNTPCLFRNDDLDNDFIIGTNDSDNTFNDRLLYVTIDELMALVERRAMVEARAKLRSYFANTAATPSERHYPYASALGDTYFSCQDGLRKGHLPVNEGCQCYCTQSECGCRNCPANALNKAEFTTSSGSFINSDSSCTRTSPTQCVCTGNGFCGGSNLQQGTVTFQTQTAGRIRAGITAPTGTTTTFSGDASFATVSGSNCSLSGGACQCSGTGQAGQSGSCMGNAQSSVTTAAYRFKDSAAGRLDFTQVMCPHPPLSWPTWFTENGWPRYIYYAVDQTCTFAAGIPRCVAPTTNPPILTAGDLDRVHALLIATGIPLQVTPAPAPKQVGYPSTQLDDYLDSPENRNNDDVYDRIGTPLTGTYNDKTYIVCRGDAPCP